MAALDLTYITQLVREAQGGSSDAFAELYAATYQEQYRFAYTYLKEEYLAQDILQQTYLQMLKDIRSIADPRLFLSQLSHTGYRLCYAARQKAQNIPDSEEPLMIQIEGTAYTFSRILSLPFTESQILLMKYGDHLTNREIARMMNLRRRTVRHYLTQGRKRLQQIMNQ